MLIEILSFPCRRSASPTARTRVKLPPTVTTLGLQRANTLEVTIRQSRGSATASSMQLPAAPATPDDAIVAPTTSRKDSKLRWDDSTTAAGGISDGGGGGGAEGPGQQQRKGGLRSAMASASDAAGVSGKKAEAGKDRTEVEGGGSSDEGEEEEGSGESDGSSGSSAGEEDVDEALEQDLTASAAPPLSR